MSFYARLFTFAFSFLAVVFIFRGVYERAAVALLFAIVIIITEIAYKLEDNE